MKRKLFELRNSIYIFLRLIFSFWKVPLNREQTIKILANNIVYKYQNYGVEGYPYYSLIRDQSELNLNVLKINPNSENHIIDFEQDYVWKVSKTENKKLQICSSGHLTINSKLILDLDYGNVGYFNRIPLQLKKYKCNLVVAPWSHNFGGYYAFLLLIMTKLCRIEAAFGSDIWHRANICYPLLRTSYETQYLEKLGITKERIINTRQLGLVIQPESVIIANNQTEINRISPRDIKLLRQKFLVNHGCHKGDKKIFLPRRGRRVLVNEAEIRSLLIEYDFEVIEDTNRTVDEQIALFNNASVIVAVHGAGLSNLVWCQPKTKVIELFYSGYTKPGFYYLATVLNLEYACLFDKSQTKDSFANQFCDLEIDSNLLRNLLDKVLI